MREIVSLLLLGDVDYVDESRTMSIITLIGSINLLNDLDGMREMRFAHEMKSRLIISIYD